MRRLALFVFALTLASFACAPRVDEPLEPVAAAEDFLGRWNMTVQGDDGPFPSWLELARENDEIQGRFVGQVGSVRPIPNLEIVGNRLSFSLPVQWESHPEDQAFEGTLSNGRMEGTTNAPDGSRLGWTAVPAPPLIRTADPEWGEPIDLLAGTLEDSWRVRSPGTPNYWVLSDGVLENTDVGTDLITRREFDDFRLQCEFRYPEGSNSGIYLRGRYEVQIQDDYGKEPHSLLIGGVYGFLTPTVNAGKPANEWQTYDITLIGRHVTIVLNGETIIDNQEIPGITGGALDGNEGEPGPIMLQGDHGPVSFRNVILTPAR
jgi:hypothetical protein